MWKGEAAIRADRGDAVLNGGPAYGYGKKQKEKYGEGGTKRHTATHLAIPCLTEFCWIEATGGVPQVARSIAVDDVPKRPFLDTDEYFAI